ncbi:MAG TPA: Ldh family oxidoreductase [Candidatus Nitrosotalea sp.]|nr:Ldh family oxidoreductase [Candidatus Nitrosotalea sp.]
MNQPQSEMRRFSIERLQTFVSEVLTSVGLDDQSARRTAHLMVLADARGADGHGVFRLPQYVRRLRAGGINLKPELRLVQDHPACALLDGDNAMGHLVMSRAAEVAVAKAQSCGAGWVGVRGSNHAGPASLYAAMPLERDMIGIYIAIGNANHMAPWGGIELLLSTNPIAIAVPAGSHPPVILDMATSVAAYGKVKRRIQDGETIPEGWMIDRQGRPLTDPERVHEGSLLPIGGPKGYGLAFMIGLLAGTLNGAAFGRDVIDFNADSKSVTNTGHALLAIDVARFIDVRLFKQHVDQVCEQVESSAPLPGGEAIRVPGAHSAHLQAESAELGVPLAASVIRELELVAADCRVTPLARS